MRVAREQAQTLAVIQRLVECRIQNVCYVTKTIEPVVVPLSRLS